MGIMSDVQEFQKKTVTIQTVTKTLNTSTGVVTDSWATSTSKKAAFYEGSAADTFVSDRMRPLISGIFLFDPGALIGITLRDTDRIIMGSRTFQVVHVDDIAQLGEVYAVAVKEKA